MVNGKVVYEADVFQTTYTVVNGAAQRSDPKVHFKTTCSVVHTV